MRYLSVRSQYPIPYALLSTVALLAVLSCTAAVAVAAVVSLLLVKATCALANSMSSSHLNISICSSFSRSSCKETVVAHKQKAVQTISTHVATSTRSQLVLECAIKRYIAMSQQLVPTLRNKLP
jgi:hypothetical protein